MPQAKLTLALVNAVNTVGVMGKGIALAFKTRFPANFQAYAAACQRGEVVTGRMFVTEAPDLLGPPWSSTSRPSCTGAARQGWHGCKSACRTCAAFCWRRV